LRGSAGDVMRWTVLTLFPEAFRTPLSAGLFSKAAERGVLEVDLVNFRDYAEGRHKVVDDTPFGGGSGMVIKVEPVARALEELRAESPGVHVVLLTPQGTLLDQAQVRRLSGRGHLALVCGRYEGVDERIRRLVDEELSIGDYVLSGGEPAAWVLMDAVSRLVPGVLGCGESVCEESFSEESLLEYPQYTRPREYGGMQVPDILLSGDHRAIAEWRRRQALLRTARRRPDMLEGLSMTEEERTWLSEQERLEGD
jgi:tRNA (guanine37-N1)-methyltransferase